VVPNPGGWSGVSIEGGMSADLSGALIENNSWNGVRVVATLGEESAAPITLNDARILSNGCNRNGDAKAEYNDLCGIVVEKPPKVGWRSRVVSGTVNISGHQGPGSNVICTMQM
jgi:hypothetical protein